MTEYRCHGCMALTDQTPCPHCGWDQGRENAEHQLPVGTRLKERYLVGRELGQGGFGITYLGWDALMERTVCIKEFYPSATVNRNSTVSTHIRVNIEEMQPRFESSKQRFLREFKALAALRDIPEIVDILDYFEENETAYIVMEYIQGIELKEYVKNRGGRLPMDELMQIMTPLMKALSRVHSHGMVHRDISPDNIMLQPVLGVSRLLDFGAVRAVDDPAVDKELTKSTESILKNGFAPMEQYVSKGTLGPWTDVYALSATIYFCLTGRLPEDAPSRMMEDSGFDWSGAKGVSAKQKRILEQGMALRTKDRIASVQELLEKLNAPDTGRNRKTARKWLWLLTLLPAAALGTLLLARPAPEPAPEETTLSAETQPSTAALTEIPEETLPALSEELEIRRILAAGWGGMVLDDDGSVLL